MLPSLAKSLYTVGARVRNPSLPAEYARLKRSEWSSRKELEVIQLERAGRFLEFVGASSPYTRSEFNRVGFHPKRFSSLEDLRQLPVTTKEVLVRHGSEIQAHGDFRGGFRAETSGTTGIALHFPKSELWDSVVRAHLQRAYDWYGVSPWDRNGYLWGYDIAPSRATRVAMLDTLQNRFRLFRYDAKSVEAFARKLKYAAFLGGYSSMIYEVARMINQLELPAPSLRLVKGTSEMILDVYQAEVFRAFGRRIVSEYGAAEAGLIAFECPQGRMHINVEDVIVEVDNDGAILVTNLVSHSFPIIRYRLGDKVVVSSEECPCGRKHPIVREIQGRLGSTVVGKSERYPALTFYYVFKNLALHQSVTVNFRAVQDQPGAVDVFVEGTVNAQTDSLIRSELVKYFGSDLECTVLYVATLPRPRGKARYFVSNLGETPQLRPDK